jgi:tRNA A-37 threonylcarbamoyl transferase component Bud32
MATYRCKKISRWGVPQERVLILTTHNVVLFNTKEKDTRKRFPLKELKYIVKSLSSMETLLYFVNENDVRIITEEREDFLNLVKYRFPLLCPNRGLKVYGVPKDNLKEFKSMSQKGAKAQFAFDNEPSAKYRLKDEEIIGSEDKGEEAKDINNDPNNFEFVHRSSVKGVAPKLRGGPQPKRLDPEQDSVPDMELTITSVDNLQDHFMSLRLGDKNQERRLTKEEREEFRSTTLVKRKTKDVVEEKETLFEDFEILMVIGRGTFGKVFLAELKENKKLYAIKSIRKDVLIQFDQVENTILEKDIMFECDHPFLVGMEYLFQNDMRLYFVMPFIRGGELYKVFTQSKRFKEETVIFYAAQMAVAIGYLHSKGIVHRDLKLENILIDQDGYIKIIDYGLAKILTEDQEATSFCGTPEYLAPEMVSQTGHDKTVDWWALGVLIYEMLIGVTPFFNKNKNMLLMKIKNAKVIFPDRKKYKIDYSDDIMDLISSLLEKERAKRLGSTDDYISVISHPVFRHIDFEKLQRKQLESPFKPSINNSEDLEKYFNVNNSK